MLDLTSPAGFEDLTDYTFRSADGLRRLTVQFAPAGTPPEEAIAAYLTRLLAMPGPEPLTVERVAVAAAPAPGTLTLRYAFAEEVEGADGGERKVRHLRESCGFARLQHGAGVVVGYVRPADAEGVAGDEPFAHALASVGPVARSAKDGFVRRAVGPIALDVPADLAPPTAYLFATPSADIRLSARVAAPGQPTPKPAYGSAEHPAPGAEVKAVRDYPVGGGDTMTMYSSTCTGVTDYVCHGVVDGPNGTRVSLSGHCRWDTPGTTDKDADKSGRVDQMIRGFEELAAGVKKEAKS
jgi:hypothetical protein